MSKEFRELTKVLTELFQDLSMPMGGEDIDEESIFMEVPLHRITAKVDKGTYVVKAANGMVRLYSAEAVKKAFVTYFRKGEYALWAAFGNVPNPAFTANIDYGWT